MWSELKRIMKPKSNAIFFGSQPFSSFVITSNVKWFKYELVWNKNKCGSPGVSKYRPLKVHENILVFANGSGAPYNPIMETGDPYKRDFTPSETITEGPEGQPIEVLVENYDNGNVKKEYQHYRFHECQCIIKHGFYRLFDKDGKKESERFYKKNKLEKQEGYGTGTNTHKYGFGKKKQFGFENKGVRYPKSILHASRNFSAQQTFHPTQKPTNILNWLIMVYSNPDGVVLDFTMGSGSTGVSAKLTGRKFIGVEINKEYYDIAKKRIENVDYGIVNESDHQLTTQIHKEMQTTPTNKPEDLNILRDEIEKSKIKP